MLLKHNKHFYLFRNYSEVVYQIANIYELLGDTDQVNFNAPAALTMKNIVLVFKF